MKTEFHPGAVVRNGLSPRTLFRSSFVPNTCFKQAAQCASADFLISSARCDLAHHRLAKALPSPPVLPAGTYRWVACGKFPAGRYQTDNVSSPCDNHPLAINPIKIKESASHLRS